MKTKKIKKITMTLSLFALLIIISITTIATAKADGVKTCGQDNQVYNNCYVDGVFYSVYQAYWHKNTQVVRASVTYTESIECRVNGLFNEIFFPDEITQDNYKKIDGILEPLCTNQNGVITQRKKNSMYIDFDTPSPQYQSPVFKPIDIPVSVDCYYDNIYSTDSFNLRPHPSEPYIFTPENIEELAGMYRDSCQDRPAAHVIRSSVVTGSKVVENAFPSNVSGVTCDYTETAMWYNDNGSNASEESVSTYTPDVGFSRSSVQKAVEANEIIDQTWAQTYCIKKYQREPIRFDYPEAKVTNAVAYYATCERWFADHVPDNLVIVIALEALPPIQANHG